MQLFPFIQFITGVDLKWSNFNSERIEFLIWQRWFCSVGSPCIAEAIHWSQPLHKVEKLLSWKFGVSVFCFCKVILKTSSVTKQLQCLCCQPTIYRWFVNILPRYDLFWWLVPEKIAFFLQLSGSKYRYFIWTKRSTVRRSVMVHSARSIALLLASFDVALPSESKKPSWIDWTIEICPSTRWLLLNWFPVRMSRFRVSHHATYCARRSLPSYRPVVHTCSHFGTRVRRRDMPRRTAHTPLQVPQHFDGARANGPLFAPPVGLISFKLYGAG